MEQLFSLFNDIADEKAKKLIQIGTIDSIMTPHYSFPCVIIILVSIPNTLLNLLIIVALFIHKINA